MLLILTGDLKLSNQIPIERPKKKTSSTASPSQVTNSNSPRSTIGSRRNELRARSMQAGTSRRRQLLELPAEEGFSPRTSGANKRPRLEESAGVTAVAAVAPQVATLQAALDSTVESARRLSLTCCRFVRFAKREKRKNTFCFVTSVTRNTTNTALTHRLKKSQKAIGGPTSKFLRR